MTLLAYVSTAQDPLFGAVLLTAYTTGFIAPLLVAASATVGEYSIFQAFDTFHEFQEALSKLMSVRQYSQYVTPISGVLLVSGGTYALLSRIVPV